MRSRRVIPIPHVRDVGAGGPSTSAVILAAVGAAGIAGLWVVLAAATGLIFHLLPGATMLAAAWIFRHLGSSRRASWPEVIGIVGSGLLATGAGIGAVTAIGRPLDPAPLTAAVAAAGALIALVWLRRDGVLPSNAVPLPRPDPVDEDERRRQTNEA